MFAAQIGGLINSKTDPVFTFPIRPFEVDMNFLFLFQQNVIKFVKLKHGQIKKCFFIDELNEFVMQVSKAKKNSAFKDIYLLSKAAPHVLVKLRIDDMLQEFRLKLGGIKLARFVSDGKLVGVWLDHESLISGEENQALAHSPTLLKPQIVMVRLNLLDGGEFSGSHPALASIAGSDAAIKEFFYKELQSGHELVMWALEDGSVWLTKFRTRNDAGELIV